MLSHDLYYPDIPAIPEFSGISRRNDHWQRQAITLWLIAQGFSLRVEVQWIVARFFGTDHRSGALMQILSRFRDKELLKTKTLALRIFSGGRTQFTVVCLTDKGRELVQALGWQVHETEWERMQRLHEKGNYQARHTAAVLAFVYQARLRGWTAGVMPEVDAVWFFPDALVEKDRESYYVEVELDEQKLSKWHNMARHQSAIALCAHTPDHRRLLLDEAEPAALTNKCTRLGTDLRTLFEHSQGGNLLWLEKKENIT
ncbi:MAG: hypothetical protein ISS57_09330 [Anaerolineales bacterium]|nr:hypothetical protein [Anaerolineales bacterium]